MNIYKPAAGQKNGPNLSTDKHRLRQFVCLTALIAAMVICGCDFGRVDAAAKNTSKEESSMDSTQATTTVQHKTAPIDAAVTSEMATATFAMG